MKILFLTPEYMGLYKPIVDELKANNHHVHVIFDTCFLDKDYNFPWRGLHDRITRRIKCYINRTFKRFWQQKIQQDEELNQPYDVFLCINGCSLCKFLIDFIEKNNPGIKKVLYLWDNSEFYGYYQYAHRFDSIFTYDLKDSINYHVNFLPIYWTPQKSIENLKTTKYTISMIGSNHSDRLNIVKKISSQIKSGGGKYYFKIFDTSMEESDLITHKTIPQDEVIRIMQESNCILDTDRPSQTGTTPRLIWALSLGKKIVTTNTNIVQMPFFSDKQISIIDRKNPILDMDFVFEPYISDMHPYIASLRIDKWCDTLLK